MPDDEHALEEERQVAAMRQVADLAAQLDAVQKSLKEAAIKAVRVGAPRRRTQELARVSSWTFYGWLDEAGVAVRPKKGSKRQRSTQEQPEQP
jgi:uncharacterized protein YcfL